ncbi:MAG: MFS transporter, partial [Armatimonadetes bacterium]|nr:MFS transporter [Armatimonadota bacterium]
FILEWTGPGGNYAVAAAAALVAAGWLMLLKPPTRSPVEREPFTRAVRAGLRYGLQTASVRRLLLLSLATEMLAFSYLWMLPVIARDVLSVGARGLGYLGAMQGVGMLAAMLLLASLGDFRSKGALLLASALGFGLFIVLFGLSPWFLLSLLLVGIVGGMGALYDSSMSTMLQLTVSEQMRGRVMGLYVSTWGLNQVGGLVLGGLATALGAPIALAITGGLAAVNALRLVPAFRKLVP